MTKKISSITTYFISIFLFGFLLLPTITNAADPLSSLKNVGQGGIDPLPPLPPIQNQTTPNYVGGPNLTYNQKTNPVYVDKTSLYNTIPDITADEKAALIANDKRQYDYAQALARSAADPSIPKPPTDTEDSLSAAYLSGDAKLSKEYFKALKSLEEKEASGEPLTTQEQALKDIRNQEGGTDGNDTLGGDLPDLTNTDGTKASSNFPTSPGAVGTGGFFDSSPNGNSPSNTTSATNRVCNNGTCQYQMLAPIPGLLGDPSGKYIVTQDSKSLCSLLNQWFRIGIALAGMLAVVMIVLGGFQYATTDSLFDKSDGKEKIQSALWGLMLALTTWLVLNTINPALTKCEIVAKVTNLQKIEPTLSESLTGAWSSVKSAAGNTLKSIETANKQSIIDADYNRVLDQWTEEDQAALNGDDAAAKKAAEDKWASIQSQLDELGIKYASQIADRNANAGPANQRVLNTIASGYTCHKGDCSTSANQLATDSGVKYNSVYQSDKYQAGLGTLGTFGRKGSEEMPKPGDMVDVYTGGAAASGYPFHAVILDHYDEYGNAWVWDWDQGTSRNRQNAGDLRKMTFTFDSSKSTQKGFVGKVYEGTVVK